MQIVGAQFIAPLTSGRDKSCPYDNRMMCPDIHHRRSIHLQGYDYAQAGAYFFTICTQNRECLFGEVADGETILNEAGRMVEAMWDGLPGRFPTVELDQFVVMPNHIHGILVLVGAQFIVPPTPPHQGAIDRAPTIGRQTTKDAINHTPTTRPQNQDVINHAPTLGEIIRAFKAVTTRQIRLVGRQEFRWQRNYYEHVIRDEDSLNRIREYIATNPLRWELDRENPRHQGEDAFDRWLATFKSRPDKML
jgi:REP element-mobilizing transposase RayT